jgi:epidermal growth factor receptor substrate 15
MPSTACPEIYMIFVVANYFAENSSDKALSPSPFASTTSPTDDHEDIFSTLAGSAPAPTTAMQAGPVLPPAAVTTTAPSKGAFDDLDDEFEGLEDAKEGSADDDFANISRSGLDDFNAVFDSSPPVSQPKSESTAFGAESSFDFGTVSTNSGVNVSAAAASSITAPSTQQQPASAVPKAESQDWDALFAGLDSPAAEALTETPTNSGGNITAPEAKDTRPTPGRALTEEGLHDDPILKNLTSMGYSRVDALQALEKYDYNLERVRSSLITTRIYFSCDQQMLTLP